MCGHQLTQQALSSHRIHGGDPLLRQATTPDPLFRRLGLGVRIDYDQGQG